MSEETNSGKRVPVNKTFTVQYGTAVSKSDAVFSIITVGVLALFSSFYVWVVISETALQAVIEAQATIFGFFGLIIVYWLTSVDSRIDRLTQMKDECEMKKIDAEIISRSHTLAKEDMARWDKEITNLNNRLDRILTFKEKVVNEAWVIGVFLVLSLIMSIGLLAFQSVIAEAIQNLESPLFQLAGIATGIPLMVFFESIWFIFSLFKRMGKKPKMNPPEGDK
jgi:uncharacterized membrane protein YesL